MRKEADGTGLGMVKTMNRDSIIFACANPTPEIFSDDAKAGEARVVSTGRNDYLNQINNVLAFPGIFQGAFDVRASDINEEMKMVKAKALADLITEEDLNEDYIIPKVFDKRVGKTVARAVTLCKIFNLMPEKLEVACYPWFQFIMKNLTTTLLAGIGICYPDIA